MSREEFRDKFQKKYQKETGVEIHSADKTPDTTFIPTGILSFDASSGIGGFPRGRMVEVFGPESGGKSLLALVSIAYAQKILKASTALYFDLEGGTPREWLETLNIKTDDVDIVPAGLNAEQVLDAIIEAVKSGGYDYIVVDSVAGMVPKAELEGEINKAYIAELARALSKGLKKIVSALSTHDVETAPCVIMINQIREKPGTMFGNPETTPGGRALKFYSAQRYRVTKKSQSQQTAGGDVIGHVVKITNKKNKLGPPLREGEFFINYTQGVDTVATILSAVKSRKMYVKKGQKYHLTIEDGTEPIVFNKVSDIEDKIRDDQEFQMRIYKAVISKYFKADDKPVTTNEGDEFSFNPEDDKD